MIGTAEKYLTGFMKEKDKEEADRFFEEQNLALIRTWTPEQRRLEYASVQFELTDDYKMQICQNIQDDPFPDVFLDYYLRDLHNYGKRIRHVMQELDLAILGIEIEERERIGGVDAEKRVGEKDEAMIKF